MTFVIPPITTNTPRRQSNAKCVASDCPMSNSPAFKGFNIVVDEKASGHIKWLGDDFTSAMQRLVSGITAFVTQPFFDLTNDKTDEQTRIVSCSRTLGKIIAGTLTGVVIRDLCIRAMDNFCKNEVTEKERVRKQTEKMEKAGNSGTVKPARTEFKPHEQWLLPEKANTATFREIKKYKNAVGTFAAVGIMIFTNFLIDAPLTTYLTNVFTEKFKGVLNKPKTPEGGN